MISKSTLDALRTSIVGVGLVEVSSVSFAASAPGVADIFDEGEKSGGLVMPVGDVASLSKNPGFLWDDNETARLLSMGARERVEQAFSLQTLGLSFTSSLENEVLSRHQPVRQFVNDAVEGHTLS